MRVLGVTETCDLGALYLRLQEEGHEARISVSEPLAQGTMAGMVPRVADWRGELEWVRDGGVILFEAVSEGFGALQDELRRDGYRVVGGSEYGEAWHKAGMLDQKQHVFDDFIGAAEYLIQSKYTNPSKIAISGGSNGGLLVGACMTQRPELFKVALPAAGVMDMLRFQKFTIGWAWVVEYGSSDNAEQFKYLLKYSPLHNLKPGTAYPATLITTADHDDRVVPAHSFKFAATLQADNAGPNPALIRIETNAGHGAGKPTSKLIDEAADIWAFTMYNLGMNK